MKIIGEKIAVHCSTEELLKAVINKAIIEGTDFDKHDVDNEAKRIWRRRGDQCVVDFQNHSKPDNFTVAGYKEDYPEYEIITAQQYIGGKMPKEKQYKFLVTWDTEDEDPVEYFYTLAEAKKKATKLNDTRNVISSSIRIVEIKKIWQTISSITMKEMK